MALGSVKPAMIEVEGGSTVSGLLQTPRGARAVIVLAHGAGAGMNHPFMVAVADGLAARGVATLRYQFPYMERGSKRPDPPPIAHAAVRAAVAAARRALSGVPLPGVPRLAFLAFPLHPAGKPARERGEHLPAIRIPMLFLQGTRDTLA